MKKALLLVLSSLMVSGVAIAQDEGPDNRSAWAKSQDMYVEPTLRITETTIPVTPEQAAQQNLSVREVPAGTATAQSTTTVVGPDGHVVQQQTEAATTLPSPTLEVVEPTLQQGAPVHDLSRPVQ
ncbi:MAG: hypothetical protein Q4G44_00795 [Alcaligenaceae bacterium]|nr:hypothetical protein [Alcaligenaceae bacterium]